jgi:hypothetical protein
VCGSLVKWWPWLSIWDDCLFLQFFILSTLFYIFFYRNVYYNLLYLFLNFFAVGIYLAVFQVGLFTAFLWLIECSVIFVMLLLFFFLNIKGNYSYVQNNNFYEAVYNPVMNDLFGFSISYYLLRIPEFIIIGWLLLFELVRLFNG